MLTQPDEENPLMAPILGWGSKNTRHSAKGQSSSLPSTETNDRTVLQAASLQLMTLYAAFAFSNTHQKCQ